MSGRPWAGRRLHFIGVGGAGMSGYARAAHALGAAVSGSDKAQTPYLERLREEGVLDGSIGHRAGNVPQGADVEVIYSSAVASENPERVAARERGLPDHPRAVLLAELTALRPTIAVAGAHGKTTTSSMIVHILRESGSDPSWLVGSSVGAGLDNSFWAPSGGGWLVVEADESDRSMLSLNVEIAVLTNVELDHHATYGSLAELRQAFGEFLARARSAIVVWDRPELLALLQPAGAAEYSGKDEAVVGERGMGEHGARAGEADNSGADRGGAGGARGVEIVPYDVPAPKLQSGGSRFQWRGREVSLSVPGIHNALNATAALEVARLVGVADGPAAIATFNGAARRFQRLGATERGAIVIDDYAHHPTEIAATLSAAHTLDPKRLIAVFQPHLYSRTALLAGEFGAALAQADLIVLLDVYPARERSEDHPGVSGLTLLRSTVAHAGEGRVLWRASFEQAEATLRKLLEPGDLCVVMGAGNVDALARRLVVADSSQSTEPPG